MIDLISIKDQGNIARERAVFRVAKTGDIGAFMIHSCRSVIENGEIKLKNRIFDTYWFGDRILDEGDMAVLYTKRDDDKSTAYKIKNLEDGHKTHFFYWGKSQCVWDKNDISLVIGKFSQWRSTRVTIDGDDVEPV